MFGNRQLTTSATFKLTHSFTLGMRHAPVMSELTVNGEPRQALNKLHGTVCDPWADPAIYSFTHSVLR